MEPRKDQEPDRFQIEQLEERIAPSVGGTGGYEGQPGNRTRPRGTPRAAPTQKTAPAKERQGTGKGLRGSMLFVAGVLGGWPRRGRPRHAHACGGVPSLPLRSLVQSVWSSAGHPALVPVEGPFSQKE